MRRNSFPLCFGAVTDRKGRPPKGHGKPTLSRSELFFAAVSSLFFVSACMTFTSQASRFVPRDPTETLPPWRYQEMVAVVLSRSPNWKASEVKSLELLAWFSAKDDRPVYLNVALFCVELDGGDYGLAQLAQNPIPSARQPERQRAVATKWGLYDVWDDPWEPTVRFRSRPTAEAVKQFLRLWPGRRLDTSWSILTCGVRARTWRRALGMKGPERRDMCAHREGLSSIEPGGRNVEP